MRGGVGYYSYCWHYSLRLGDVDGALERLAAHGGDEGGDGPREEAGVGEAQAAVHGVGRQLERLLPHLWLLWLFCAGG